MQIEISLLQNKAKDYPATDLGFLLHKHPSHMHERDTKAGKAVIFYSACVISQGVNVGDYTRVLAGSVVTNDIESKCVAGGIPAKIIRKRDI